MELWRKQDPSKNDIADSDGVKTTAAAAEPYITFLAHFLFFDTTPWWQLVFVPFIARPLLASQLAQESVHNASTATPAASAEALPTPEGNGSQRYKLVLPGLI